MVLLIFAAILIIAALILLLSPVIISIESVRSGGKTDGGLSISWLLLMVRYGLKDKKIEIFTFNRKIASRIYKKKRPPPEKIKKPEKIRKPRGIPPIRQILALAMPALRLFIDLVTAIRFRGLNIGIVYGLNDPAYTGILAGFLYAVRGISKTGYIIRFTPDFTHQVLDWDIQAKASITPIRIVLPLIRFVTNRQVLRMGWRAIKRESE